MKTYLAGGMRSGWQDKFDGYDVVDPRDNQTKIPREYTFWDVAHLQLCDLVFAYLEDDNPSGFGLAVEIGIAIGRGKPVIFVNEKQDRYTEFASMCPGVIAFSNFEEAFIFFKKMAK